MENLQVVDDIVEQAEHLVSRFYGDEETVFVFTADHGMSKIGNHGDGGTSNPPTTRTPTRPSYNPVSQTLTTLELLSSSGVKASEARFPTQTHPRMMGTPCPGI